MLAARIRGAYGTQVRTGFRVSAGHRPGARLNKIGKVFELMSLPAPPAGFEPAHTAPERVAV
jgi:hypothetical protein